MKLKYDPFIHAIVEKYFKTPLVTIYFYGGGEYKGLKSIFEKLVIQNLITHHILLNTMALLNITINTSLKLVLSYYTKLLFPYAIGPLLFKLSFISLIAFPHHFFSWKLHLKNYFITFWIMQNFEFLVACVILSSSLIHTISLSLNPNLHLFKLLLHSKCI